MNQKPVDARLTIHGARRLRKRVGRDKSKVSQALDEVLLNGRPAKDFKGQFRNYIDHRTMEYKSRARVHNGHIYLFDGHSDRLITVYPVPGRFRKYLK